MQRMLLAAWGTWGEALASALRPHAKLSDLRVFSNSITDAGLQASSRAAAGICDLFFLPPASAPQKNLLPEHLKIDVNPSGELQVG